MTAVDLTKRAGVVLQKFTDRAESTGAEDVFPRAELYIGADHSGSMRRYYNDRAQPVTQLARQIAALGLARLDPDGQIPVWFYASQVEGPWTATQESLWPEEKRFRATEDVITHAAKKASWGSTNTAAMVRTIARAHEATGLVTPGLAVIQTDGCPNDQSDVIYEIVEASSLNLFYVFVGYGTGGRPFLDRLDQGGFAGQVVDNVATFDAPVGAPDEWVMEQLLKDVPAWRTAAAGKVRGTV